MGLLHLSFGLRAVTNEPSDFDIRRLAQRYRTNIPTNSALSTVFNSAITNMTVIKRTFRLCPINLT
jgi:hypothetical protein